MAAVPIPFEWDPSNPYCLLLPYILKEDLDESLETDRQIVVSDGTCADHELTALLKILTRHFEHHQLGQEEVSQNQSIEWKDLSRQYRKAIKEALDIVDNAVAMDSDDNDEPPPLQENDLLLHSIYAALYLSEIYIPLTSLKWEHENPYDKQGYVTADTVRYLRQQHGDCFTLRNGTIFPEADLALMYESTQPDKFRGDDGAIYWEYIEYLTRTGRLEEVAELLLRHSLYTTTSSEDLKREFAYLCALLLVAPIPGGRNRENDDSLEALTFGNEDFPMLEEGPVITDVGVEDFKHWETGINQDIHFSSFGAVNAHRSWQDKIARVSLPSLQRYLPREISEVLNILSGSSLHTPASPELQLLEELLYKNPNWTPTKVAARALGLGLKPYDTRIMHGDVLEALTQLRLGGSSSGAALPSTLYALVVSLYSDAEILPDDRDDTGFSKTDMLCNAAFDIITSLSDSNPDIGAQQGVRLLVPYVLKEGKREYISSIASILSQYKPSTIDFARTIISLCEPLVNLKSIEVLEGCTDVLLYIFREMVSQENFDVAADMVMQGLKLEAKVYPSPTHGSCFEALNSRCRLLCTRLCESLLERSVGESSESLEAIAYLAAFHDPNSTLDIVSFPIIAQLETVWALFEAIRVKATSNVVADRVADCLNGPANITPALRETILSILTKEFDDKDKREMLGGAKAAPSQRTPSKLQWAEQLLEDTTSERARLCVCEFVENTIATNSERAKHGSRNAFGSTTDMRQPDGRPFDALSEGEKLERVLYLSKRIEIE